MKYALIHISVFWLLFWNLLVKSFGLLLLEIVYVYEHKDCWEQP